MQRNLGVNRERLREAIGALREYQPLAAQILELAVLLDRLADIALEDVKAINETEANQHMKQAVDHLQAVTDERRNMQVGAAMDHVEEALHHLQPSPRHRPH